MIPELASLCSRIGAIWIYVSVGLSRRVRSKERKNIYQGACVWASLRDLQEIRHRQEWGRSPWGRIRVVSALAASISFHLDGFQFTSSRAAKKTFPFLSLLISELREAAVETLGGILTDKVRTKSPCHCPRGLSSLCHPPVNGPLQRFLDNYRFAVRSGKGLKQSVLLEFLLYCWPESGTGLYGEGASFPLEVPQIFSAFLSCLSCTHTLLSYWRGTALKDGGSYPLGWVTVGKPEVSDRLTVISKLQGIWSERHQGKAASVWEV